MNVIGASSFILGLITAGCLMFTELGWGSVVLAVLLLLFITITTWAYRPAEIDESHPAAISYLDRRNGVGNRNTKDGS